MSGDSVPLPLPLARLANDVCEVTTLYRELRQPLLRYLVCLGLSADEAQDVVQDAFLMLHRHLAAGGSKENVRGWVFRVAHNGARNRQKSYERRFAASLDTYRRMSADVKAYCDAVTEAKVCRPELTWLLAASGTAAMAAAVVVVLSGEL